MTDWDARFIDLAELVGSWSKDPSTKVGAVIVRPDRTVASVGYNGFARGVKDTEERLFTRDLKYAMVVHAEANAIVNAREPLHGYCIYVWPFPPCSSCASLIVQAGIARVVAPTPTEEQLERWGDSMAIADTILSEGGLEWTSP